MAPNPKSFFCALLRGHAGPRTIKTKPIKPRDATKPSLANLNHDILNQIIEHLRDIDPPSLNAVALVCSALLAKARYVQFRDVSLDFGRDSIDRASRRVRILGQNASLLPAIRTLRVQPSQLLGNSLGQLTAGSLYLTERRRRDLMAGLAAWKQIGDLVPRMPGLRDLHWSAAVIPDRVVEFLGNNPKVRLHLFVDMRFFHGLAIEEAATAALRTLRARLAGTLTQGLSSLCIRIVYGRQAVPLRTLLQNSVKPLILSSPQLRSLRLDIGFPKSGCVWHSPSRDYCGFGFSHSELEAFPPLQELDIEDYPWGRPWWFSSVLHFWADGYPTALDPDTTEMEHWASLHDWSNLRRLRLVGHSIMLATHLAPKLTSLQHIELISRNLAIKIPPIFAALPSPCALTSIALAILPPDLIPLIPASIRTLSVYDAPGIPPADRALLRDRVPNLDILTVHDPYSPSGGRYT